MNGEAPIEIRAVERLDERVPFRHWTPELRAQWEEFSAARINRELRFMHWVGLATCIACLFFDANAGVLGPGLVLRLGLVVPAYLVGVALLRRANGLMRTLATVAPIAIFAAVATYFGLSAQGAATDRYMMASAMLIAICVVLLPLRAGATLLLAGTGYAAIAIPVLIIAGIGPGNVDLFVFVLLCCIAPILIKLRNDRVKDSNFLLTLKSRQAQEELLASNRQLETLSKSDALTGVLNRRGFEQRFAAAFEAARQTGDMVAVLLLDIDHFKRFNDTHGHQAGDRCLVAVGRLLNGEFARHDGFVGRFGGEEFVAALVGEASREAAAIADDIRTRIARLEFVERQSGTASISVSIGVRIGSPASTSREVLVTAADRALYAAKDAGRNRVVVLGNDAGAARDGAASGAAVSPGFAEEMT